MAQDENEFIVFFIEESTELLNEAEGVFLELEKDPQNKDHMSHIFRLAHNLKGSAAAVGLADLSKFAHNVENLLSRIMKDDLIATSDVIDVLLACLDVFNVNLHKISSDHSAKFEDNGVSSKIDSLLMLKKEEQKPKNIGQILVETNLATQEDINYAAKLQTSKIGEILVDKGVLKEDDLEKALKIQEKENKSFTKKQEEFVRLPLGKIDNLLDALGEQAILESTLENLKNENFQNLELVNKTINQLAKITHNLQQTALSLRMFGVKGLFDKIKRIVRDTSKALNKEVNLVLEGENIELDKSIIDELASPLTHLVRNALDHGLETTAEREAVGKPIAGTLNVKAYTKGGFFYLVVSDDGRGLNKERIFQKAVEKKLCRETDILPDEEIYNFIFASDFSTKEKVTEVSGRGVGMDVVKQYIQKLKGNISIETQKGRGTAFILRLPLSLGIFNGMIIKASNSRFIIANSDVKEIIPLSNIKSHSVDVGDKVIKVHEKIIPIIDLKKIMRLKNSEVKINKAIEDGCFGECDIGLVVDYNSKEYAISVNEVLSQQRIVLKNLGPELENIPGIAGGTILPDGSVGLILEINEIVRMFRGDY